MTNTGRNSLCRLVGPAICAAVVAAGFAAEAAAQTVPIDIPVDAPVIRSAGWAQFLDVAEIALFLGDVLATFAMTVALAYHPSRLHALRSAEDMRRPLTLFLYALIGLTVGFLVMQHGYMIGFVIFGIGGLLRFRTSGETAEETMRMILATVVGLCVGLDLPAIALMVTAVAWLVIYALTLREVLTAEVKFSDDERLDADMAAVEARLRRPGVRVVSVRRKRFKSTAEFVVNAPAKLGRDWVGEELAALRASGGASVSDWHVE